MKTTKKPKQKAAKPEPVAATTKLQLNFKVEVGRYQGGKRIATDVGIYDGKPTPAQLTSLLKELNAANESHGSMETKIYVSEYYSVVA